MSVYHCPHCQRTIFETKVYYKQPEKVVCPYCHKTFNPSEPGKGKGNQTT